MTTSTQTKHPIRRSRHLTGIQRQPGFRHDPLPPIFRWAGSKRKLLPRLSRLWPNDDTRYIEPFAGSACLFFYLRPTASIISDTNHELIDAYKTIASRPRSVYTKLQSLDRTPDTYYRVRSQRPSTLSATRRAVRFLYLNRNCFNGIYRTNLKGQFNVPFGMRPGDYPPWDLFHSAAQQLRLARLRCCDFGSCLRHATAGDFVYIDPPYAIDSRRVFREYGAQHFGPAHLNRLRHHLNQLERRHAIFVVSYADCRESRQLAKEWPSTRIKVRRHVAGFAGHRRGAHEIIMTNSVRSSDSLRKLIALDSPAKGHADGQAD